MPKNAGPCPKGVMGRRGRQADGTAGLPQLRKYPCVPALTLRAKLGSRRFGVATLIHAVGASLQSHTGRPEN
jgi:hypothetical protein